MVAAPVYRHLDAKNRLFGLSLGQAFAVAAVAFFALTALSPLGATAFTAATYAAIRIGLRGRPEGCVRHWSWWMARRLLANGRLSGQARSGAPRFPYAPHIERDVASRRGANGTASR